MAPATCSTFLSTAANDVWYSFVATGTTTTVEVTGGGDATTGYDTIVEVFSGTCLALTSLGCMDSSLRAETEAIDIATVPGTTYLYRMYYWNYATAHTVFDYTTCVYSTGGGPVPPNDQCFNVVPLPLSVGNSVAFSGDNTNATSTNDYVPGSDFDPMDPTVWHAFTTRKAAAGGRTCVMAAICCCWLTPALCCPSPCPWSPCAHMSAFSAQMAVNLEPVYTIAFAIVLFHEQRELGLTFYLGVTLLLLAVTAHPLLEWWQTRRQQPAEHPEMLMAAEAKDVID